MKKNILFFLLLLCSLPVFAQLKAIASDTLKFNQHKQDFSIFVSALNTAGLGNIFTGDQPITILAPDNEAFEKLPPGVLDSLLKPANSAALISLINEHIIPGKLMAKDMAKLIRQNNGQTSFATISGIKLSAKINENRNIVLVDEKGAESIIKQFDIQKGNAVIFVVSSVIMP